MQSANEGYRASMLPGVLYLICLCTHMAFRGLFGAAAVCVAAGAPTAAAGGTAL